ncbi:hypothetical protein ACFL1X_14765 [Candidatus Hydrogenedentota bacterium]
MNHLKVLTVGCKKGPSLAQGTGTTGTGSSGFLEPGPIDMAFVIDVLNAFLAKKA